MPRRLIAAFKIPAPSSMNEKAAELNKASAKIHNKTLSLFKSTFCVGEVIFRSTRILNRLWYSNTSMHFSVRKKNPDAKPPFRAKQYMPTIWKVSAIHIKNQQLVFSNGQGNRPFVIPIPSSLDLSCFAIKLAKLVWDPKNHHYYIHLSVEVDGRALEPGDSVVAVDLGVVHPFTAFNGHEVRIWNGGELNSKLQYKHKRLAGIQQVLSRTKPGSRKHKKLLRAKQRVLRKLSNQITDILHKIISSFVEWVRQSGARVIVIGDVGGIRNKVKYHVKANQKIHDWKFRKITSMIEYKAKLAGIEMKYISEEYTSQTCPVCGHRRKPSNRHFKCPVCGFEYHRDGVRAINIHKKYLSYGRVVADLAPAIGVKFNPHLRGPGVSPWKLALSQ